MRCRELQGAKMHLDGGVRTVKLVSGNGPVPAPPSVPGAKTQKPPRPLLSMAHHVREVLHHPAQVAAVNVREEAGGNRFVGRIFEDAACRLIRVLDGPFAVQSKNRNVRRTFVIGSASKFRGRH